MTFAGTPRMARVRAEGVAQEMDLALFTVRGGFLSQSVPQKARGSITRRTPPKDSTAVYVRGPALQTVRRSARRLLERAHELPLGTFGEPDARTRCYPLTRSNPT